jgi:photosystem II stability/assembly factor-like uncharacterized protein
MKKLLVSIVCSLLLLSANAQWVQQVSGVNADLRSVHFTGPGKGHIAYNLGTYGGVLRTTNGTTWSDQLLSFAPFNTIHFANSDTGIVAGGYGMVMKTTDGGVIWDNTTLTSPTNNYWISDVHYIDPSTVTAGAVAMEFYKSVNAGNTWTTQATNVGIASIFFTGSSTGYTAGTDNTFAYRGMIGKTTDGGATWTDYTVPKNYTELKSIHFPSANIGFAAGQSVVLKTTNAGSTWTMLNVDSNQVYNDVFFADNNIGYIVAVSGAIFKTIDGGATWISQPSGTTHPLNSIYCTDANTCYAVGDSGVIVKTTNGGVGINESFDAYFINAYPNPFHNETSIEISQGSSDDVQLRIYDISGREVKAESEAAPGKITISSKGLSGGLYFFTLHRDHALLGKGKLIIE